MNTESPRYVVTIEAKAVKDLKAIRDDMQDQILEHVSALAENPRPQGAKQLRVLGRTLHRIRVGDYRVIYRIEDRELVVEVVMVWHRKDVYKRLRRRV